MNELQQDDLNLKLEKKSLCAHKLVRERFETNE